MRKIYFYTVQTSNVQRSNSILALYIFSTNHIEILDLDYLDNIDTYNTYDGWGLGSMCVPKYFWFIQWERHP